jgi:hypothetical protein
MRTNSSNELIIQKFTNYADLACFVRCHVNNAWGSWVPTSFGQNSDVSNKNLLDNWYFGNPVNQRGATTYTADGFCIDRWRMSLNKAVNQSLSIGDGCVVLHNETATGTACSCFITQAIENPGRFSNKTVTFSVKFKGVESSNNAIIKIRSSGGNSSTKYVTTSHVNSVVSVTMTLGSNITSLDVCIGSMMSYGGDGSFNIEIESAKLEIGSISTLTKDAPPKKSEQLLECQRYFWKSAGYNAYTGYKSTTAYAFIQTPVLMRTTPTVTLGSTNYIYGANGRAVFSGTGIASPIQQQGQFIRLILDESKADATQGSYTGYTFVTGESGISLSAEI